MLAHAAHGNALGVPEWLLVGGLASAVALTWLGLRATWPAARLPAAAAGRLLPLWSSTAASVLVVVGAGAGLAIWALTVTAGLFAVDDAAENLAPFAVNLQLLLGGMLLAAVVGDWWRAASPFEQLARLLPDQRPDAHDPDAHYPDVHDPDAHDPDSHDPDSHADPRDHGEPGIWTAPALLATFAWMLVAFHEGGQPRVAGSWLALYTAASLVGAAVWGRTWLRTGEGFAVLFGAMARIAPFTRDEGTGRLRLRPPLAGLGTEPLPAATAATCLIVIGAAAFGAVRRLDWWQIDVMGPRSGWDRTMVDTLGLVVTTGLAAIAWTAASRRREDRGAAPLVPLTLGVATAFLLTDLIARTVDFVALLSDPFGRDWNLLGTADWFPDARWQSSGRLAWLEIASLLVGALAMTVVAHDRALASGDGRAHAERRTAAQLTAGTALSVVGMVLLLR